ncbi:MAG TPA: macro domain-containing protein [Solirubrobacterales bacterium]|jgi:O-acetyl-ADP-ribose deacetylase (regulator of RNase III)|nr:macro domain-containing protein [Solirubrobacterales bacterium]
MGRIEITEADITKQQVDAIVNAANSDLMHSGGVALAIARAAGPRLLEESGAADFVPTGGATATTAGDLDARYVIHAVGPIWRGGQHDEAALLAAAYRRSIEIAADLDCAVTAFPSISTGIYGYPVDLAAPVALRALHDALEASGGVVQVARLCLYSDEVIDAYMNSADAAGVPYEHVVVD